MKPVLAAAAGYLLGLRVAGATGDELGRALVALRDSEELADVLSAVRTQLGNSLREWAALVEGGESPALGDDVLARVTRLVGRD